MMCSMYHPDLKPPAITQPFQKCTAEHVSRVVIYLVIYVFLNHQYHQKAILTVPIVTMIVIMSTPQLHEMGLFV